MRRLAVVVGLIFGFSSLAHAQETPIVKASPHGVAVTTDRLAYAKPAVTAERFGVADRAARFDLERRIE